MQPTSKKTQPEALYHLPVYICTRWRLSVGPIEGVALELHLRGSVRLEHLGTRFELVVASLQLRGSVRSTGGCGRAIRL